MSGFLSIKNKLMPSRVLLLSFKALFLLIYGREEVLVSHPPQIHFHQLWLSFFAHPPLSVVLAVLTSWEKAALSLPAQACYSDNLTQGWWSAAEDSKGLGHLMGLDTLQSGWQICLFTESEENQRNSHWHYPPGRTPILGHVLSL